MATTYNHVQIGVVDASGNVSVLYPINTANDVTIDNTNSSLPASVSNAQELIDNLGNMAFDDGEELVYITDGANYDGTLITGEINDDDVSLSTTWSSNKITTYTEQVMPSYECNTIDDMNARPSVPTTKIFDNTSGKFKSFTDFPLPNENYLWIVEYTPLVKSEYGSVTMAYERWYGVSSTTLDATTAMYVRVYNSSLSESWGSMKKMNLTTA